MTVCIDLPEGTTKKDVLYFAHIDCCFYIYYKFVGEAQKRQYDISWWRIIW